MISRLLINIHLFLLLLIINEAILFGGGTLLDEVLLLFSSMILVMYSIMDAVEYGKMKREYLIVLILFVYSFFLFFWSSYSSSLSLMLAQTGIVIKPFITMLVILRLFRYVDYKIKTIKYVIQFEVVVILLSVAANIILQSSWNEFLDVRIQYRYGFLELIGIFNGPGNLGNFFIMLAVSLVGIEYCRSNREWLIKNNKKLLQYFFLVLLPVLLFIGVRKPVLMVIPIGYYLYKYGFFSIKKTYFIQFAIAFLILGGILVTSTDIINITINNLSDFFNPESGYIRGLMFYHGVSLFLIHFPFGVSAATFGSNLSIFNTMDVYEKTGLVSTRFIETYGEVHGIFDSGFASFLAEFGFAGCIIYYFFVRKYLRVLDDEYHMSLKVKILTFYILIITIFSSGLFNGITASIYCLLLMYLRNEQIQ